MARFFINKGDADPADMVQDTFLAALSHADTYRAEGSLRSWLLGIAYNKLRHRYQRAARAPAEQELGSVEDLDASPSQLAMDRQEHRLLLRALRRIPLELQTVLELHYWESMKAREIAEVLAVPEGTVHSRLHRARARLEHALGELAAQRGLRTTTDDIESWVLEIHRLVHEG